MISIRVPDSWLKWIAAHPKAIFLDFLMFFGFGCIVAMAFLFDLRLGVGILGLASITLAILIATSAGESTDGNA